MLTLLSLYSTSGQPFWASLPSLPQLLHHLDEHPDQQSGPLQMFRTLMSTYLLSSVLARFFLSPRHFRHHEWRTLEQSREWSVQRPPRENFGKKVSSLFIQLELPSPVQKWFIFSFQPRIKQHPLRRSKVDSFQCVTPCKDVEESAQSNSVWETYS